MVNLFSNEVELISAVFVLGWQEPDSVIHRGISLLFFSGAFSHIGSFSVFCTFLCYSVGSISVSSVYLLIPVFYCLPSPTFFFFLIIINLCWKSVRLFLFMNWFIWRIHRFPVCVIVCFLSQMASFSIVNSQSIHALENDVFPFVPMAECIPVFRWTGPSLCLYWWTLWLMLCLGDSIVLPWK